ncbi:hypothetical protein [Sphingomonas sp. SRS2]|uniref:hypothetical protein n=1 Tax=Sphingomonas sp. SRS2 TaxID=133190 RepID=UPI0006184ADF|nr:hypothetical protein [Sphingomonas sp. SRS2]KKC27313.1 hypothetical protein WP12_03975 [Sphingomonas sp. SRS2]
MNALATLPPGDSLPIVSRIRPGLGVVPIIDDHNVLLQLGDVAVYSTDWLYRDPITPGLWAIEYQRPPSCMPYEMVARRFADREPVRFEVTRSVVRIARYENRRPDLNPHLDDHWMIHPLSPVGGIYNGRAALRMSDGPIWTYHLTEKLLGPIIGIYAPMLAASEHLQGMAA